MKDKLGVTSLAESDCDYAPLALGQLTNGITVREMTQAYSAFVNDGVFTYGRTYSYVKDSSGEVVLENPARTIVASRPTPRGTWPICSAMPSTAARALRRV